jgi:hypothetical protein
MSTISIGLPNDTPMNFSLSPDRRHKSSEVIILLVREYLENEESEISIDGKSH